MIFAIIQSYFRGFLDLLLSPWYLYQWAMLDGLKPKMNALLLTGYSSRLLCALLALMTIIVVLGLFRHTVLVKAERVMRRGIGTIGQIACWFVLIMMLQQVMIIIVGQVFRGNEILFSPFGMPLFDEELQWLSGQLKFYNAVLIAFASAYTFIEGGHVRVDLIYGGVSYRVKKWIDLVGTIVFLFPTSIVLWWFAWPLAMNSMFAQRPLNVWSDVARWRNFKWESSGTAEFTWVWSFKLLILVFALLMLAQAFSFLLRNIRALREPEELPAHPRLEDPENGKSLSHDSAHSA